MNGYVTIPRFIFDDPSYTGRRFSRTAAIIDLIQLARYEGGNEFTNGRYIYVGRGQLCKSVRWLASRWRWDEKTVMKFLKFLENSNTISVENPTPKKGVNRLISIVNYDNWSDDSNTDSNDDSGTTPTLIPTQLSLSTDVDNNNIKQEIQERKNKDTADAAARLYSLYPSSAVRAGGSRVSLKSTKDKQKLERLLKTKTEEELANTIKRYLSEKPGAYIKMFATFLNNLPDYSDDGPVDTQPELPLYDKIRQQANKPQEV